MNALDAVKVVVGEVHREIWEEELFVDVMG